MLLYIQGEEKDRYQRLFGQLWGLGKTFLYYKNTLDASYLKKYPKLADELRLETGFKIFVIKYILR